MAFAISRTSCFAAATKARRIFASTRRIRCQYLTHPGIPRGGIPPLWLPLFQESSHYGGGQLVHFLKLAIAHAVKHLALRVEHH